jgi:hypothetical protein
MGILVLRLYRNGNIEWEVVPIAFFGKLRAG